MWQTKLISLYCAVCDNSSIIKREMQRQSNNIRPQFTDEECITVYLWGISQRRFEQKAIYYYTKNHLSEWFPKLPKYQAFSRRCAALAPAFRALAERRMEQAAPSGKAQKIYMVDSCPIMLAYRSRSGYAKVAGDLCAKNYNSTRNEWYYGVKLHAFTQKRTAKLPVPAALSVSCADVHDLTAAKQMTSECAFLRPGWLYCDKAYIDADWKETLEKEYGVQIRTPRKKQHGDTLFTGDTMSTVVSSVRQPVESFFNWLSDLTNIKAASKVRSSQGLLLHIFGRVAFAICYLMPVFIIGTYNADGTPNAMNAAWGGISEETEITICVDSTHKTAENLMTRKAFTVSMATANHVAACDYVGLVSGNKEPDKFAKAGFHATKSEFVDAPLIDELPMALECEVISYDPETCRLVGRIVNVSADESVLGENGKVDVGKLRPITFDTMNNQYLVLGEQVGQAFREGTALN